jgi:hypothetical protein
LRPSSNNPSLGVVDILYRHIANRLQTHKCCVVFNNQLQRIWPVEEKHRAKRVAAIEAFARAHGLIATIHDPGIRVTFRRAPQESGATPDRQLVTAR